MPRAETGSGRPNNRRVSDRRGVDDRAPVIVVGGIVGSPVAGGNAVATSKGGRSPCFSAAYWLRIDVRGRCSLLSWSESWA